MLTFIKTVLACAALFAIVPLVTWAVTGSARQAREALKGYATVLALIAIPGVVVALIVLIP